MPVANRVGDENEGWRMLTTQLNHERVGLAAWSGLALSLYEDIVDWAAAQPTETFGVRRLGDHLAERFGLRHVFLDVPNPV